MKKTRLNYLSLLLIVLVLASCGGLKKMKKLAGEVQYTVTPSPLEMHADSVSVSISGKYPAKYFNKKATLEITPVIKYATGEKAFPDVKIVQGEKVKDNNSIVNFAGGSFSYTSKVPYNEGMRISDLEIRIVGKMKKKEVPFDPMPIAKGVIATPGLVQINPKSIIGKDNFQRITKEVVSAELMYALQQSSVSGTNANKADVKRLKELVAEVQKNERLELTGVSINGGASWDGNKEEINAPLADKRAKSASDYINNFLKKLEKAKESGFVTSNSVAEDWAGFERDLKNSDIQDKEIILGVLNMHADLEVREAELKKLASVYDELRKKILPKQRRSVVNYNLDHIGYSDEEISAIFDLRPDSLKVEELLYAATLTKDNDRKLKIYKSFTDIYPTDWRGPNNVGAVYVDMNKVSDAKAAFEDARKIDDNNKIVINNLGVVALLEGDVKTAEELFTSASGAGDQVNYNMGIVYIKKADYEAAVGSFGSNCSFNSALAVLLNGDADGAVKKVDCADNKEDAAMYYLKAVAGARKADSDLMFNSLRAAIGKDATWNGKAKTDMEFFKFFGDDTFKSIVK
ncbi:MAG: hypothetical protein JXR58_01115 [Bacteroidales bacterium]|nr:hypothetical protein [Bacteroidales bacterium]